MASFPYPLDLLRAWVSPASFFCAPATCLPLLLAGAALAAAPLAVGCGDDGGAPARPAGDDDDDDDGQDDDARDAGSPEPDVCDDLGLSRRPFQAGPGGDGYAELAGDFTVETLDGPWTLSDAWSGCESYVFVNYIPTAEAGGPGDQIWRSNPVEMFRHSTRNARYVFGSYETDPAAVRARVEEMRTRLEVILEVDVGQEQFDYWKERFHFITEPLGEVGGGLGAFLAARPQPLVSFGIDRRQRWDWAGLLNPFVGAGQTLAMAGFPSRYYEYHASLEERLEREADEVTVVPLVDEAGLTERVLTREGTLPDAATMAGFDELVVDVKVTCRLEVQDCSEWDRNAYVRLCLDEGCPEGGSRVELVRWITPYWRPGERRWLMDATPGLGFLADGGARSFRIELGPDWERPTPRDVEISLRFRRSGAPDRPVGAELAFRGALFSPGYNDREPFAFTPPADVARVELVTIVSGHGDARPSRCAEWCAHDHRFQVNEGVVREIAFPEEDIFSPVACAERALDGVPTGQGGNWAMSRAYWCPGLPVPVHRMDVTDDVRLGEENQVTYEGVFDGPFPGDGARIDLSTFVVYYR